MKISLPQNYHVPKRLQIFSYFCFDQIASYLLWHPLGRASHTTRTFTGGMSNMQTVVGKAEIFKSLKTLVVPGNDWRRWWRCQRASQSVWLYGILPGHNFSKTNNKNTCKRMAKHLSLLASGSIWISMPMTNWGKYVADFGWDHRAELAVLLLGSLWPADHLYLSQKSNKGETNNFLMAIILDFSSSSSFEWTMFTEHSLY